MTKKKSKKELIALRLFLFSIAVVICGFVPRAQAGMVDHPTVKLQVLDKSTARTMTLEAKVGTTLEYGSIFIKVQACRKSEPLDKPESASFLQIWEVPINSEKSEWIFSGWMFASSPALSTMNHPVYDVWVLDCINKDNKNGEVQVEKPEAEESKEELKSEVMTDENEEASDIQSLKIVPKSSEKNETLDEELTFE